MQAQNAGSLSIQVTFCMLVVQFIPAYFEGEINLKISFFQSAKSLRFIYYYIIFSGICRNSLFVSVEECMKYPAENQQYVVTLWKNICKLNDKQSGTVIYCVTLTHPLPDCLASMYVLYLLLLTNLSILFFNSVVLLCFCLPTHLDHSRLPSADCWWSLESNKHSTSASE